MITTKKPEPEPVEFLTRRITDASRYIPLERLGLSPQCGFASSIIGNSISPADQQRKLTRLVETAEALWG